jgi:cell division protein FtsI/penicillin-binding protein 2
VVSPKRNLLVPALVLAVLAGTLAACSKDDGPGHFAAKFLNGWSTGDFGDAVIVSPAGERVEASAVKDQIKTITTAFGDAKPTFKQTAESDSRVDVAVTQPLPGGATWDYQTSINLKKVKDGFQIVWEPAVIHPQLKASEVLAVRRTAQTRGGVLGAGGDELIKARPIVIVNVWPAQINGDKDKLVSDLVGVLAPVYKVENPADLAARVKNPANNNQLVEVVPLRREIYDQVRAPLQGLTGLRFTETNWMLAESATFGSQLLGKSGPVTKEIMDKSPGVYAIGDQAGLSGLQRQYDERLRGKAGVKVVIARKAPDGTTQDTVINTIEPVAGAPLKTTIDSKTQRVAEAALGLAGNRNAALVAIRVSDGQILAAANKGVDYNMAFNANVPPGSTFKAVSALGLLDAGKVTFDQGVACPGVFNVAGRPPIHNSGNFDIPGNPAFHIDFYRSCNTAFASLAPQLGPTGLAQAGATVGLGQPWDLGTEAFSGKVSQNGDAGEQAAAAFGQGTTIVSPLSMAGVAAAIARGQWKQPKLILDPAPAKPAPDGPVLKASSVDPLRQMMREVVTLGTAASLADVPGDVRGKTGTAEYVTGDPEKTHAWFIGWSGDIAFAVFVEQGVKPAETALPITEAFLRGL